MARKGLILFAIQIIFTTFVARKNNLKRGTFRESKYAPIEYCTCSTCASSGARKIGVTFNQYG